MKKILSPLMMLCLVAMLVTPMIACAPKEEPMEEDTVEVTVDDSEGTMEEMGEDMDEGMEEMGDDMEEMGEEMEEGAEEMHDETPEPPPAQ